MHFNEIENSVESYLYTSTSTSHKIYIVTIIAVLLTIIALPFIYVDISTQSVGVIRPRGEKTEVKASVSELIDSVYVREGQFVKKGDILLRLRSSSIDFQIDYQGNRLREYEAHISDLEVLANGRVPVPFNSPMRRQEYLSYRKKVEESRASLEKANVDLNRNSVLHQKGVISSEEYEGYLHTKRQAQNTLASTRESQLSAWQSELNSYREQYHEMENYRRQEEEKLDMYYVKSPVDGTLDLFTGIYAGGSTRVGETLAVISPDSTLYAEVQVSTRDIGNIVVGMPVTIQIESFNYNEWGVVKGTVEEISSDFFQSTDTEYAYYKVKCNMEKNYLTLRNGRSGYLKKGMSIQTNFIINRKSLFELLYMKADEIFNPRQYL
ncbi:HlyD family secretion protein [Dysgonomonas sp. OttesenSCG-928-M03]|nr:HlyD family secretion protein [Dysgonomonas sp. OttesenSCG-928-M03]